MFGCWEHLEHEYLEHNIEEQEGWMNISYVKDVWEHRQTKGLVWYSKYYKELFVNGFYLEFKYLTEETRIVSISFFPN